MSADAPIEMAGPWITAAEEQLVQDAMRSGWYGAGAYTYCETLEAEFAAYHDRAHALMTPNCTTALHLLLAGLGIGPGDEVIAPDCTWIGSTAAVSYVGADLVFADIEPDNWCVSAATVEALIGPRTRAVIVVDLYGNMPDMTALQALCTARNIHLIEDAAEALGSKLNGVRAGKFGVGSVFSFHRTKTMTTGEGGMLLTDDPALFQRCKLKRDHGRQPRSYDLEEVAFKYMPFNVQAALGLGQFRRVDELVGRKRWLWQAYRDRLADVPEISLNPEPEGVYNGVWCTAAVFDPVLGRDGAAVRAALENEGLPARPFFMPLSSMSAYGPEPREAAAAARPVAYDLPARAICLPCALNITEAQVDRYIAGLRRALGLAPFG